MGTWDGNVGWGHGVETWVRNVGQEHGTGTWKRNVGWGHGTGMWDGNKGLGWGWGHGTGMCDGDVTVPCPPLPQVASTADRQEHPALGDGADPGQGGRHGGAGGAAEGVGLPAQLGTGLPLLGKGWRRVWGCPVVHPGGATPALGVPPTPRLPRSPARTQGWRCPSPTASRPSGTRCILAPSSSPATSAR